MGVSKSIQDAIKTISEQAVNVAPYDKTRGGAVLGKGDVPNTYKVQVDGVVYSNVKAVGGIIPSVNDTVTVLSPTNNTSQMIITNINNNSWIKGASDLIYPVGTYYWTSDEGFDPNVSFSGTWEQIDAGVTLVSAGTGYPVVSGTTKDGGDATHTLTIDEMPRHRHKEVDIPYYQANRVTSSGSYSISDVKTSNVYTEYEGGGQAHNNMPPYKAAYCWHRIS